MGGDTHKLICLFILREERSLLLLLVLDKGLEEEDSLLLTRGGPTALEIPGCPR